MDEPGETPTELWCSWHNQTHPTSSFSPDRGRKRGFHRYCKAARQAGKDHAVGGNTNLSSTIQKREPSIPDFEPLDHNDHTDTRKKGVGLRTSRPEQPAFRRLQLAIYTNRCPWTGLVADDGDGFEAMHFRPVWNGGKYHPGSGCIALSAINKLWDAKHITINPTTMCIVVMPALRSSFGQLHGRPFAVPDNPNHHPDRILLIEHYTSCVSFWRDHPTTASHPHETPEG